MSVFLEDSMFFGMAVSLIGYGLGMLLKRKFGFGFLNPLLLAIIFVMVFLKVFGIEYETYEDSAKYLSYLLTPATVCLAIPLYQQLVLLKKNLLAVVLGIVSGTLASMVGVLALSWVFRLSHEEYVTLLPKSITTAIGMGVSEEAGGIVTLTVVSIVITGISGSILAETMFKLFHIGHPISRGLALGTSAHAIGTAKALELGEIEGAMSSLSIAVAGLMTVLVVPLIANWI